MSESDYEELRRQADGVRDRLLSTLAALDRKRHQLRKVRLKLKQHPVTGVSVAGGVLAGLIGYLAYRVVTREQRAWRDRARAGRRAWLLPRRVASDLRGPFVSDLARHVLFRVLQLAGVELGRRACRRLLRD
jgi:hypothetical protein